MNQQRSQTKDEIDLIEILETLWKGKWYIITSVFLCLLIGIIFVSRIQETFDVSTAIQKAEPSVFIEFKPINDVLEENELLLTDKNRIGYLIHTKNIFNTFLSEFNDYEEMKNILLNDPNISPLLNKTDGVKKEKQLTSYAKSFEIFKVLENQDPTDPQYELKFVWNDIDDGIMLFQKALELTLMNVKTTLYNDIDKLADSIDLKNQRQLADLNAELNILIEKQKIDTAKRIQYLSEQSSIAKELGIEKNRLDANALLQSHKSVLSLESENSSISLNVNPNDFPFYLRGYKAIDKEISIIKNRTKEQQLLLSSGYDEIKKEILLVENDLSPSQLRSFLDVIRNDDPLDWVEYDLSLSDIIPNKNTYIFILSSILIGLVIGVIIAVIMNAFRKRYNLSSN